MRGQRAARPFLLVLVGRAGDGATGPNTEWGADNAPRPLREGWCSDTVPRRSTRPGWTTWPGPAPAGPIGGPKLGGRPFGRPMKTSPCTNLGGLRHGGVVVRLLRAGRSRAVSPTPPRAAPGPHAGCLTRPATWPGRAAAGLPLNAFLLTAGEWAGRRPRPGPRTFAVPPQFGKRRARRGIVRYSQIRGATQWAACGADIAGRGGSSPYAGPVVWPGFELGVWGRHRGCPWRDLAGPQHWLHARQHGGQPRRPQR